VGRDSFEKVKEDRVKWLPEIVGKSGGSVQIVKEMVQKVKIIGIGHSGQLFLI
jgi:hypothetical protein